MKYSLLPTKNKVKGGGYVKIAVIENV